ACYNVAGIGTEHPVIDIDLMGPEIGNRASSIAFEPPPIAKFMHVGVAVFVQLRLRHGLIAGKSQVGRDGTMPLTADVGDAPEQPIFTHDMIAGVQITRIAAALMSDLKQLLRGP